MAFFSQKATKQIYWSIGIWHLVCMWVSQWSQTNREKEMDPPASEEMTRQSSKVGEDEQDKITNEW